LKFNPENFWGIRSTDKILDSYREAVGIAEEEIIQHVYNYYGDFSVWEGKRKGMRKQIIEGIVDDLHPRFIQLGLSESDIGAVKHNLIVEYVEDM